MPLLDLHKRFCSKENAAWVMMLKHVSVKIDDETGSIPNRDRRMSCPVPTKEYRFPEAKNKEGIQRRLHLL